MKYGLQILEIKSEVKELGQPLRPLYLIVHRYPNWVQYYSGPEKIGAIYNLNVDKAVVFNTLEEAENAFNFLVKIYRTADFMVYTDGNSDVFPCYIKLINSSLCLKEIRGEEVVFTGCDRDLTWPNAKKYYNPKELMEDFEILNQIRLS